MISRAAERQIAEFTDLLQAHFARIKQEFHQYHRKSTDQRDLLLRNALVLAYRDRENFDPSLSSVGHWFQKCLKLALYEDVITDLEEQVLLATLEQGEAHGNEKLTVPLPDVRIAFDPAQKANKECPPCWRCKFFDGWLPKETPKPPSGNYGAMDLLIYEIDQRKIEIANYVRDKYPEFLEN